MENGSPAASSTDNFITQKPGTVTIGAAIATEEVPIGTLGNIMKQAGIEK